MSDRYIVLSGSSVHLVWDKQEQVNLGTYESETEAHEEAHSLNYPEPAKPDIKALIDAYGNARATTVTQDQFGTLGQWEDAVKAEVKALAALKEGLEAFVKAKQGEAWDQGRKDTLEDVNWVEESVDANVNPYTGAKAVWG